MTTPAEVMTFLRKNYPIVENDENDSIVKFVWRWEDGRTQIVLIQILGTLLRVMSPFAKKSAISADKALTSSVSIFGVVLIGDFYCLTHTVLLENADTNEIEEPIRIVAIHADEFEKALGMGDSL